MIHSVHSETPVATLPTIAIMKKQYVKTEPLHFEIYIDNIK